MPTCLSVLIPTIPSRRDKLTRLVDELERQRQSLPQDLGKSVEILYLGDNKSMTIGEKRERLLHCARGTYIAYCDDDDWPHDEYLSTLAPLAARIDTDVICFRQKAVLRNGFQGEVHFDLGYPISAPFGDDNISRRFPWHVCVWRKSLAVHASFAPINYGEDFAWVAQMQRITRRGCSVPRLLQEYRESNG